MLSKKKNLKFQIDVSNHFFKECKLMKILNYHSTVLLHVKQNSVKTKMAAVINNQAGLEKTLGCY